MKSIESNSKQILPSGLQVTSGKVWVDGREYAVNEATGEAVVPFGTRTRR